MLTRLRKNQKMVQYPFQITEEHGGTQLLAPKSWALGKHRGGDKHLDLLLLSLLLMPLTVRNSWGAGRFRLCGAAEKAERTRRARKP